MIRDFLFDVRTKYFVLDEEPGHFDNHPYGEGDPKIYAIARADEEDIPAQWSPWTPDGTRSRVSKLDPARFNDFFKPENRIASGLLSNVYAVKPTVKPAFVAGSDEDFETERQKYDTKQNTVRTTGTGYTFATIQANINAGASGDVAAIYGNGGTPLVTGSYNENITDNALDGIQLIGMLESADGIMPAIRIHANAGDVVAIGGNDAWHIENFEIDGESGAAEGIQCGAYTSSVYRCVVHDCTGTGITVVNRRCNVMNCIVYDCGTGFNTGSSLFGRTEHCTAVDNTGNGFEGSGAGDGKFRACLASNNGTDYANASASECAWNVSSDLTAPGAGSRTNFNNANFANYAGDDFRLAAAGENGANIDGWPLSREDYLGNLRERDTLIFYAGAHDPFTPAVGATPTCLGIVDAQPAAQGSIWIRFYEMCVAEGTEPYRYDVHVKRFDNGPLTAAEIDAGTYYARSFYADELNGCGGDGSPAGGSGGLPGILQALIAFEAPNDITASVIPNDENMHLFTNRQYWIAIRAVAIDATDTIFEDDNEEVALSYSSGHQGELWTQIIGWPCLEMCAGNPIQNVQITGAPALTIGSLPDVTIGEWPLLNVELPPIDAILRAGDEAGIVSSGPQGG